MAKKINNKAIKLIKFYNFINYNLIYNNKAINRYKKDNFEISVNKIDDLKRLKKSIQNIQNCNLKANAINMVFGDGNPKSKIMIIFGFIISLSSIFLLLFTINNKFG